MDDKNINLKKSHLYDGGTLYNNDFYRHHKNDENSLDDPLFTGFTFDIDFIHSPLFYMGKEYENKISDTLRSGGGSDSGFAEFIEKRLSTVYKYSIMGYPDSYEINVISARDQINGDRMSGYGLQDKFYIDNVLYGATDYIYMVDKVSEGTYSDEIGVTDIGNGTLAKSTYEIYDDVINDVNSSNTSAIDDSDLEYDPQLGIMSDSMGDIVKKTNDTNPDTRNLSQEIEFVNSEIADGKKLKSDYDNLKASADYARGKYDNEKKELDSKEAELEKLLDDIDDERFAVSDELSDIQDMAARQYALLRHNISEDNENIENINKTYNRYKEFIDKFNNDNNVNGHITTEFTKSRDNTNYTNNIKELSEVEKAIYDDQEKTVIKKAFEQVWEILNTRIINCNASRESLEQRDTLNGEIKDIKRELYGLEKEEYNADETSLYGIYKEAKRKVDDCEYSKMKEYKDILVEAKENYYDVMEFNKYDSTKKETTSKQIPVFDYERKENETDEDYNKRFSEYADSIKTGRKTFEIPQTVYDIVGFISGMKNIVYEYPYIMQSITGLEEAYKKYFVAKEPYQGSGDDKITITCYESLDLRVSSMFNKYFNAVYDHQYKRERVPINLRRFNCSVFVHDIRNFRNSLSFVNEEFKEFKDGDSVLSKIVEIAINHMSAIEFKFYDCEIVSEETGGIFDAISNEPSNEMKKTNFTFTYGNCVVNYLPFGDLKKYYKSKNDGAELDRSKVWGRNEEIVSPIEWEKQKIKDPRYKSTNQYEDVIKIKEQRYKSTNQYADVINKYIDWSMFDPNTGKIAETVRDLGNAYDQNNMLGGYIDMPDSGDFRRWFDKSELGNVNNNDYRDYIRHDSSVVVDDFYRTNIVNDFALDSVVKKNRELTQMDDALRKIVLGISASTGIPPKGVADSLNIGNIYSYINNESYSGDVSLVSDLGNIETMKIIDTDIVEHLGKVIGDEDEEIDIVRDLGKV